jgi:hypothetical protein
MDIFIRVSRKVSLRISENFSSNQMYLKTNYLSK